jgi:hypothetical protein
MFEGIPEPDRSVKSNRGGGLIGIAGLLVTAVVLALFGFGAPRQVPWVVADGKLLIHARFIWSEDYPVCDLQIGNARVLDLTREAGWLPGEKIYGFDGGSYKAGNFNLRNGKEVELALAKETVAVFLPRKDKVPVMVGVTDSGAFLSALRAACPSAPIP